MNLNIRSKEDCLVFLKNIPAKTARAVIADFQYRGILDKQKYGNEKTGKQKDRAALPQMTEEYIVDCINQIGLILKPTGYFFLWVDKFHLINLNRLLGGLKCDLEVVSLITWDKVHFGLGHRPRCQSEFLVVLQRPPILAKKSWTRKNIPDVWSEKLTKDKIHVHQKPEGLIDAILEATCLKGELVIDPCAGSFKVGDVCKNRELDFIGNDIVYGEESFSLGETSHLIFRNMSKWDNIALLRGL